MTAAALETLGRYLETLPGRKNVLWFSGSFPFQLYSSDRGGGGATAIDENFQAQVRKAAASLTAARASVYAIDPRGLQTSSFYDVESTHGTSNMSEGRRQSVALFRENMLRDAEHATMQELAESTGGRAFFDTNGLDEAIRRAVSDGSHFYTLTYSPGTKQMRGEFRHITVQLRHGSKVRLAYRHGYYATPTGITWAPEALAPDSLSSAK